MVGAIAVLRWRFRTTTDEVTRHNAFTGVRDANDEGIAVAVVYVRDNFSLPGDRNGISVGYQVTRHRFSRLCTNGCASTSAEEETAWRGIDG